MRNAIKIMYTRRSDIITCHRSYKLYLYNIPMALLFPEQNIIFIFRYVIQLYACNDLILYLVTQAGIRII